MQVEKEINSWGDLNHLHLLQLEIKLACLAHKSEIFIFQFLVNFQRDLGEKNKTRETIHLLTPSAAAAASFL